MYVKRVMETGGGRERRTIIIISDGMITVLLNLVYLYSVMLAYFFNF